MKNKWVLVLGVLAAFGAVFMGCDNGSTGGGGGSSTFDGTWSKGSGSDEGTLIISLTTGEWSSVVSNRKNPGGIFILASATNGSLKTKNPNNTGNAVLSSGKLYVTGFSGIYPSQVNGTYTKKSDDDEIGEYQDGYWT
jgi:hypothetical protein